MPRKQAFWWREPVEVARRKAYMKEWAEKNPEKKKANFASWRAVNVDEDKARCLAWQAKNKDKTIANIAKYKAAKLQRIPPWADLSEIEKIYEKRVQLELETGEQYDVDHIIPLQGKTVSGLHVHTNLRIIPRKENRRKGNRFSDGH